MIMERTTSDRNILDSFCARFCSIVEKHAKYIIVSGFLIISLGRVRGTEDIDMILEKMNKERFIAMHKDLRTAGFVCMQTEDPEEIYDAYLTKKASVRYTYDDIPIPEMEIKFAKDELDEIQLRNRVKIPPARIDVWFASINSTIAFKEEYLKSQKDMEDAQHIRRTFPDQINEREIAETKKLIRKYRL